MCDRVNCLAYIAAWTILFVLFVIRASNNFIFARELFRWKCWKLRHTTPLLNDSFFAYPSRAVTLRRKLGIYSLGIIYLLYLMFNFARSNVAEWIMSEIVSTFRGRGYKFHEFTEISFFPLMHRNKRKFNARNTVSFFLNYIFYIVRHILCLTYFFEWEELIGYSFADINQILWSCCFNSYFEFKLDLSNKKMPIFHLFFQND